MHDHADSLSAMEHAARRQECADFGDLEDARNFGIGAMVCFGAGAVILAAIVVLA